MFAASASVQNYDLLDFSSMDEFLDYWKSMGYDYTGSWDTTSRFPATPYNSSTNPLSTPMNTNTAIIYYIPKGATPSKINPGYPLYGSSFNGPAGPGTSFGGIGTLGTYDAGTWYYNSLPVLGFNATPVEIPEMRASYSYDAVQNNVTGYDTPNIAAVNAQYVTDMGLGGSAWCKASMDTSGTSSLISTTVQAYGGGNASDQSLNHLNHPTSIYDNSRSGFPASVTNSTSTSAAPSLVEPSTITICTKYHLVVSGDTCNVILEKYGITSTQV